MVDCTLGDGGHSEAILEKTAPKGKVLGMDADTESLLRAKRILYRFGERIIFVRDNFINLEKTVIENEFKPVNGVLMDLGWSMSQFAERGRGFSFEKDEPLDMRYYQPASGDSGAMTAEKLLNQADVTELEEIFKKFGEEELSREIAEAIVAARKAAPIERTNQLNEVVLGVYRKKLKSNKDIPWVGGLHPATKVYQALRIAVNRELEALKQALPQAVEILAPQGRLAVITFHSLEDRIVKHYFQSLGLECSLITKKPIIVQKEELIKNPRARSAKLRVIEKK